MLYNLPMFSNLAAMFFQGKNSTTTVRFWALILCLYLISGSSAFATIIENYNFPGDNGLVATVSTSIIVPKKIKGQENLTVKLQNGKDLKLRLYKQKKNSPLVYLITGLHSGIDGEKANFLAQYLYKEGLHVAILPNTFSKAFIETVSSSRFPGLSRIDARDYYRAIVEIDDQLSERISFPYRLGMGISSGALTMAYLRDMDDRQLFTRTILINPPFDMQYGMQELDSFIETPISWVRKGIGLGKAIKDIFWYRTGHGMMNSSYFFHFYEQANFSEQEARYMIGLKFRMKLIDFAKNVPNRTVSKNPLQGSTFDNFTSYVREVAHPNWKKINPELKGWQNTLQANGLEFLLPTLAADESVFILHNQDDFLVRGSDIKKLNARMGKRAVIYPRGGHIGNIWHPHNQSVLKNLSYLKNWLGW